MDENILDKNMKEDFNESVYQACENEIRRMGNVLDITPRHRGSFQK